MDFKSIKGNPHYLFDDLQEYKAFGNDEEVISSWRKGDEDDWVYTDDGFICQILKKSQVSHPGYKTPRTMVRTVEFLFARYVASGENTLSAYKKAYPMAQNENYIKKKSNFLLQKEEIRTMVKEEIQKILNDEGVTPEWIIGKYRDIVALSESDSNKLRSLDSLTKISGLFDTDKKQEQLTVFQGFTPKQLEALQSGKETNMLAHAEKEEEEEK